MEKITYVLTLIVTFLFLAHTLPNVKAEGEYGINQYIDLENTPISNILHEEVSVDNLEFDISIELVEGAISNGTNVEVWTQICINSGVCFDPVWHCENVEGKCTSKLEKSDDNSTWTVTVVPDETHTYVNYKVKLQYPTNTENETSSEMFSSGKVWSNCWVYGDSSGGDCAEGVPSIGVMSVVSIALLAAIIRKN